MVTASLDSVPLRVATVKVYSFPDVRSSYEEKKIYNSLKIFSSESTETLKILLCDSCLNIDQFFSSNEVYDKVTLLYV